MLYNKLFINKILLTVRDLLAIFIFHIIILLYHKILKSLRTKLIFSFLHFILLAVLLALWGNLTVLPFGLNMMFKTCFLFNLSRL